MNLVDKPKSDQAVKASQPVNMDSFTEILNNDNSMILAISTQDLLGSNGLSKFLNSFTSYIHKI